MIKPLIKICLLFLTVNAQALTAQQNLFKKYYTTTRFSLMPLVQRLWSSPPTTLLATLKTIENLWRYEKQNQNARDIADRAANIYDKFRGFIEDIEKLGKQLDTTQNTYHDALNKLTRGKGNLMNQAQQLLDLGVKVKKEIPKSMLEKTEFEKAELESSESEEKNDED